jgi:hypothetical protein
MRPYKEAVRSLSCTILDGLQLSRRPRVASASLLSTAVRPMGSVDQTRLLDARQAGSSHASHAAGAQSFT